MTTDDVREFLNNIPDGDPDCPECGGVGWVKDEGGACGRCEVCMPPSFVATQDGIRQGDADLDCTDIGGRRVRNKPRNENQ